MHVQRQIARRSQGCVAWRAFLGCRPFTSSSPRNIDGAAAEASRATQSRDDSSSLSSSSSSSSEGSEAASRPRWSYTPERMKAPFSLHQPKDPRRSIWKVNEDPAKLNRMYERLVGNDLTRTLPDELKWLAVTHKSFDNGRRGFNTRLAFYGRMIVALETTRAIMGSPAAGNTAADPYGRKPFENAALDNVDKLNTVQPHHYANPDKVSLLAKEVGLTAVVRWKPRMPDNLEGSGITVVLTSTVFAIIGAISLHYGGDVASRVVREKILKRLSA